MKPDAWFAARGWQPHAFQRQVWKAMADGRSGLLHATTGSGKTFGVWMGALLRARPRSGLQVLWLTPMRALAADTTRALSEPLATMAPGWQVGQRTGDTAPSERARQERRWPAALVTTPESLSLMLTRPGAAAELGGVHTVIVDEWHELIGNKRGVQVQLALARLRRWQPGLIVWGLSATLGNLEEAMATLVGAATASATVAGAAGSGDAETTAGLPSCPPPPRPAPPPPPLLVQGKLDKALHIDTLLPAEPGRFSWGGHLGAQMQQPVVDEIERTMAEGGTTLVFTNTRSQAEIWYQLLLAARPDWAGLIALHHGSIDKATREWVELGLKGGQLKAVVATSSLDLGVDFLPVERVLQIGSAKGVARLLQRAGRSGHAPGRPSRITLVPTNTLELVEAVAARTAALSGRVESRRTPVRPLDVLVQHLVTVALGGDVDDAGRPCSGFDAQTLYAEVCSAPAYADLSRAEFDWALAFCAHGGDSLTAYPEYHRIMLRPDAALDDAAPPRWQVPDRGIARRHRLQVGTIVSDASMQLKWWSQAGGGATLGTVEEGFIARLNKGDVFVFGGRLLEYVCTRDLAAFVRRASKPKGVVPAWAGSKMPLSSELGDAVLEILDGVARVLAPRGDGESDRRPGGGVANGAGAAEVANQGDNDVANPARGEADDGSVRTDHAGGAAAPVLMTPELRAAQPMLAAQARLSRIPRAGRLLVEQWASREGEHLFVYPFAGRNVHIGLAQLLAWRLARSQPNTFSLSVNDYGFEIVAAQPLDAAALAALHDGALFDAGPGLMDEVLASLNSGELAQRRFREIARVAGLVFSGYPGAPKSLRQLQASSSLFYEVFRKYDAGNRLLNQAEQEVLAQELELGRLQATLQRMAATEREIVRLPAPSPFSLPLMVERLREQLSTEKLSDRLQRMLAEAEAALAPAPPAGRRRSRATRRAAEPGPAQPPVA